MKILFLSQGKTAWIDDKDYPAASKFKWSAMKARRGFYAYRKEGKKNVYLHRFLLPNAPFVDHRDGNKLDCRRKNLRACTRSQNLQGFRVNKTNSKSRFRGVSWDTNGQNWRARIVVIGKELWLGGYPTQKEAARAYDAAARKYFGEFACPNFPL